MPKNYMTSLPQTTDTRKGFIQGADAPKVPAMDYRSGFRNVGEAVDNTNKFLDDFSKMKYEGFQADLDKMELEHLHEMEDATDPCQLEEINEKWKKEYNSALKDDFWAKSYYKSTFYKKWQDRNQAAQQKVYYAKQHEFAEICAVDTLNKMSETASMLDNPADIAQYIQNANAMLANVQHLTAENKYKLMSNFYKDTVSRLYNDDPNKAVAWLDYAGNRYDGYGVSSNEIRSKAENYNKAREREARIEQDRMKREAKEEAALVGQQGIALYNRGIKTKSEVEDSLWTLGMQSGNYKPYNDFMKATKPKSSSASKTADMEIVGKYTAGLSSVMTEDELNQYDYDFKAQHLDMSSATRTQINDISSAKSKIVMKFSGGGSSESSSKITDNFGYTDGDVDIILQTPNPETSALEFARFNNLTTTQRTNLVNEVKARVGERTKAKEEKISNYKRDITDIESESLNDTEAMSAYVQKRSEIDNDDSLDTIQRNDLIAGIKEKEKIIRSNRQKAYEEKRKAQGEAEAKKDMLELQHNLSSAIQSGGVELADYNEEIVSDYEKDGLLSPEFAKSLQTEIQNQRDYALEYRLHENTVVNPDNAKKYNPKNPDEVLKKIYAHNDTVYSNLLDREISDTVNEVIGGKQTYEDGLKYVSQRANAYGKDIDIARKDFDTRLNDSDFAKFSSSLEDSFLRYYGAIDENDKYQVNARKQSKNAFYNELSKVWNDKKTLNSFTDEVIKSRAEQARATDNISVNKNRNLMSDVQYIYSEIYASTEKGRDKKQKEYDNKPSGDMLRDWDIILKAKNNTSVQSDKIDYAYNFLKSRVNNYLINQDFSKSNIGLYSLYQYALLSGVGVLNYKGTIAAEKGVGYRPAEFLDLAGIYEKVNPYLEANGYLINSPVGNVENSNIALAAFIDQFEGITTPIIVGDRLYSIEEIKTMRERTKDVKRPQGR